MFTLLIPVAEFLPTILKQLDLPEVMYRQSIDTASQLNICTASVHFSKNHTQLRLFTASSPDGPVSAKHLAATAAIHQLKQAFQFIIVDLNHKELFELKGISSNPSPLHVSQVSPPLDDVFDPESFMDFTVAEKIAFGISAEFDVPQEDLAVAASLILEAGRLENSIAPNMLPLVGKTATEVPAAKKFKQDKKPDTTATNVAGNNTQLDCFQELKSLRKRFEELQRENARLQAESLDNKLRAMHYMHSKSRYMRLTRNYFETFKRIEASDAIYRQAYGL
ncbi:hypothetical protein M5689_024730 [Euphorbia peplus]|nr:hypothetical protein M5689_024730 [Euphorbia peplus]